ncbi:biotin carboxyl carrier protein /biotin carboxylase [Arboricoccus pini]|uniref:propionyl-CoA carboxylase n=1 Tax=Arboricoccus pini TaxID=1963835 RepID=A0A212QPJ0_9PROT|nr:acetyl/propionyl/methylcrotonyl-CoA carboxylase subunit alpha [Arboricoccus pini]SNB61366.1 biotin carboxyl carrier protein /biotin carboxylase [Arboricoccus pini]
MFKKILIANRGEIACRIIRTCDQLGIPTVAVYSEADAQALFVRMAGERVAIGTSPAAESYLRIEAIIEACRQTGADAVHPGYGFLSERAAFAQALEAEGITFIGPPVAAIEAMGDKIESKRLARAAGVSTVQGTLEPIEDAEEALRIASEIGYPLMVKASAGGGGKGMRVVKEAAGLADGLERARSEARSSFGDDRVFIEKFITDPRHIEIQVLGDRHGTILHLGERECSIQRRHQKVIEEAPSPFLDEATRAAMGAQAISLARAVDYHSAGTVEFIVDGDRNFYFLEMNTRLQVEHPVTEMVYGVDLVEEMIKIAAGQKLKLRQQELVPQGWAVEARIYAEEPARGFLPSIGRLVRYEEPGLEGLRIDSGVVEGGEVSMFYDPMIAKIVGHGASRQSAIDLLRQALDMFVIDGPRHNVAFLSALLAHPRFAAGRLTTGFIAEEFGERFGSVELPADRLEKLAAVVVAMRLIEAARAVPAAPFMPPRVETAWVVEGAGAGLSVDAASLDGRHATMRVNESEISLVLDWRPGLRLARATFKEGTTLALQVRPVREGYVLRHAGAEMTLIVRTLRAANFLARTPAKERAEKAHQLKSPMPGLIIKVSVQAGQEIKVGEEILVLEAMKMENVLLAEEDGVVGEVLVQAAEVVSADQVLITFA